MSEIIFFFIFVEITSTMIFSKACEYGIRATIFIATQSENSKKLSLNDVASNINSPAAFTAKILQQLVKTGIVNSAKGPNGGFWISNEASLEMNMLQVVKSIDGIEVFSRCALGFQQCDSTHPCPMHFQITDIRDALYKMLNETKLNELSKSIQNGETFIRGISMID